MKINSIAKKILFLALSASTAVASQQDLDAYVTKDFVLGRASLGCQPKGMKSNHEGTLMYVAEMCGKIINGRREATVSVIDLNLKKLLGTHITPAGIRRETLPDGRVIDGIIGNTEIEISVDGKYALAARAEGSKTSEVYPSYGMVTVIDNNSQKIIKYIPVRGAGSKIINRRPILADDQAKKQIVYVVNYFSDDISVLDITDLDDNGQLDGQEHLKKVFRLQSSFITKKTYNPIAPRGLSFTNDGKYGFILATNTGSIIIIDTVNHKQIAELAPIPSEQLGRTVNVRHIVSTNDGKYAYLSHMHGNGVSRIDLQKLLSIALQANKNGKKTLDGSTWQSIFVPFANGKSFLALEHYPKDHPNFPNKTWNLAHPNTIVLDPVNNRYLYVSHRTTSNADYTIIDPSIKGKVDIIDTTTGEVIFSAVGGSQPTALEVTPDNKMLMTAGFKDVSNALMFLDIDEIIRIYEK